MKRTLITSIASALVLSAGWAHATLEGLTNLVGNYAVWDQFQNTGIYPNIVINNQAPALEPGDTSIPSPTGGDLFSATLSASMGGSTTGGGARIYNGVGAASVPFNVEINGEASGNINIIIVQLRFSQPDPSSGYDFDDFFSLALNDVTATPVVINDNAGIINGSPVGIVQWQWSGLNIAASDSFSLKITSPASGHVSVDAIAIRAIPEPSTWALLGIGLSAVAFQLRRKKSSRNNFKKTTAASDSRI